MCEYLSLKLECKVKAKAININLIAADYKFELKHISSDPKDGDLYLGRVKSGETLMEARSDTDVQIVRQTWA
jgi:hypothetical protein